MSRFNSFCFTLATFLASSILQVGAVPVPKGKVDANFQYAVTFHNERECQACHMENITANERSCMEKLTQFMNADFLTVNVKILHKIAACAEKPNLMLLSVKLIHSTHSGTVAPPKENNRTLSIARVLECSGHLPPGEIFQLCYDPSLKIVSVPLNATILPPPTADTGKTLLDYIPTALLVLLVVALLASGLLGVLVKKRSALEKGIRIMVWGREPERQPLLGDQLRRYHPVQEHDGEVINDGNGPADGENISDGNGPVDGEDINNGNGPVDGEDINDGNDPVDLAECARRALEQPFVGLRWANPVPRFPVQHQSSASRSMASPPSRLFEALMIETPPFRKSVSPEGSGYCSLDYQRPALAPEHN